MRTKLMVVPVLFAALLAPTPGAPLESTSAAPGPRCGAARVTVRELPQGSTRPECDLARFVIHDGIALEIPDPGTAIIQEEMFPETAARFGIAVAPDGRISYQLDDPAKDDRVSRVRAAVGSTTPPECSQGAFAVDEQLTSTWNWHAGDGSYPAGLNYGAFKFNQEAALHTWEAARNNCGFRDKVTRLRDRYRGRTSHESDFVTRDGASDCGARDGVSTVDGGDLDKHGKPPIATTCTWTTAGTAFPKILEADIRYNTRDFDFTRTPTSRSCNNQFDLLSVAVHEMGHAIGLGHVSEAHYPWLTMSTQTNECDDSARTLGKGDVLGVQYEYCSPALFDCHDVSDLGKSHG